MSGTAFDFSRVYQPKGTVFHCDRCNREIDDERGRGRSICRQCEFTHGLGRRLRCVESTGVYEVAGLIDQDVDTDIGDSLHDDIEAAIEKDTRRAEKLRKGLK